MRTRTTLTIALLALALAGCGGESDAEGERVTPAQATAEIATIETMLDTALAQYRRGQVKAADRTVGDAYLEHFERVEDPLGERDHELMEALEHRIATEIRERMKDRAPSAAVAALVADTKRDLDAAAAALRE